MTYLENLGIEVYVLPTVAVPYRHPNAPPPPGSPGTGGGPTPPPAPSGAPGSLVAPGQVTTEIPLLETIATAPSSPAEVEAMQWLAELLARDVGVTDPVDADLTVDQLGGVDFSTLELRYVSDTYDGGLGTGNQYAYRVDPAPGEEASFGGREAAQLAADAFFTWLALPPERFTVNLNPDEPDRIIDADLARTDAGRVLLEADLQLKKTVAALIHPDTRLGEKFWESLQGEQKCLSMRQWIVPRPAVVHERDHELFILEAPLKVEMETEYYRSEGVTSDLGCRRQSRADTEFNEQVFQELILPELEHAVNTAPEYADLRRVYVSRVAAEWYRQRSRHKTTVYHDLIDSGDVSAWPARVEWDPQEVYERFLDSYRNGEFTVERTTVDGGYLVTSVYVYGGVDFTRVPEHHLSHDEFDRHYPQLQTAVRRSLHGPVPDAHTAAVWLGGQSAERPPWNPYPTPEPLRNPWLYVLALVPVLAWLTAGALLVRPHRRPRGPDPTPTAPPDGPSGLPAPVTSIRRPRRPASVQVAVWLLLGASAFWLTAAVLTLFALPLYRRHVSEATQNVDTGIVVGALFALLALIAAVAAGVNVFLATLDARGMPTARVLTWIYEGFSGVVAVAILILAFGDGPVAWHRWFLVAVAVLTLLFTSTAVVLLGRPGTSRFFRDATAARQAAFQARRAAAGSVPWRPPAPPGRY